MGMLSEFREFAMRGNVVDMAVGVTIGAAFGKIVNSFVENVMMPPIGKLIGNMDFSSLTISLGQHSKTVTEGGTTKTVTEDVVLRWGMFVNHIVDFTIIALCLFLVIKAMNTIKRRMEDPKEPSAPPPPADVKLLMEIRDLLKEKS